MAETTTQDVGLVERILEKRVDMDTGAVEYLIRWQGTDGQGNEYEDTWEPEENVLGVELIEEFEQSRPTMRTEELFSKRDRSVENSINPSKRKASASAVEDPESKDMSGVESTADLKPLGLQETDKRLKAGYVLRNSPSSKYISRRQTAGLNGKPSTTIRLLKLDHAHERTYFMSVIEKSELVKDAAIRSEILQFLKDPESPGLGAEAVLLTSETWLIELKKQQETPGSLFLALDIPSTTIKALFIPESLLEYQRKQHPEKGLVLNDNSVVHAIIAGDLRGSGLSPTVNGDSGSATVPPSQQPSLAGSAVDQPERNGDVSMDVDEPVATTPMINCGWRDCNETRATVQELSLHVQLDHIQALQLGATGAINHSVSLHNGAEHRRTAEAFEADASPATSDLSRDNQIVQLQSSYSLLKSDIVKMKEEITQSDKQARDLSMLYSTAIESSEENIKRLEAQLEWEKKKWDQYREETKRMLALGETTSMDPVDDLQHTTASSNKDAATTLPEQVEVLGSGLGPQGGQGFDKPMEAQAQNSIQTIQKLLLVAREKQARLEKQNQELVGKRRALESEHALLDQRYRETLAQLESLEAKDHDTAEALRNRAKGVEQCRTTIDQEQEHSRKVVEQLQAKIDELRQGSSPSPQPQPSSPMAANAPPISVQESDTNGDHIMADPISPLPATPAPVVSSRVADSDSLSPMSVEPEPIPSTNADSTLEASLLEPASETAPLSPSAPPSPPTAEQAVESTIPPPSDIVSLDIPTTLSTEQADENAHVPSAQQQEPVSTTAGEANQDISVEPSSNANTVPVLEALSNDASTPPTASAETVASNPAVENVSLTPTTSASANALPDKVQDPSETLPSEEPPSTLKTPASASDIDNNNSNTGIENATTLTATNNVTGNGDSDTNDHDSNSDALPNLADNLTEDS
ncbi:hypothetical protein EC991_000066 [Linnemannia zychae]|nr:hypothetical protein EC991_000066 [Linnemannia zychae]